jgi:signal transduction histidine kinase
LLDSKNINCRYEIVNEADHTDLDIDLRRNIMLIVKESLNNIVKYSGATEVAIEINITGNMLNLSIADNGRGFDFDNSKKGNGLQNIQYRVNQSGGIVNIASACNEGTKINCHFPITCISDTV